MASQRKLNIQVSVCKRMIKEANYYVKEVAENEEKVSNMKAAGRDVHDISKQEEVLAESRMMIPDSNRRRDEALQKLKEILEEGSDTFDAQTEDRT
mmetsp:Transcript_2282/g.3504  ORF Transcript_2282/g.3504 Transcript_2282/m.3504 type:complete len:96 (-) Transcript_2282:94-381(-)